MESAPGANPNFATLGGRDEYRRYFDLLSTWIRGLTAAFNGAS